MSVEFRYDAALTRIEMQVLVDYYLARGEALQAAQWRDVLQATIDRRTQFQTQVQDELSKPSPKTT